MNTLIDDIKWLIQDLKYNQYTDSQSLIPLLEKILVKLEAIQK